MKNIITIFTILLFFVSCNSEIKHERCAEISKIEVFSVGYPNITFMVDQSEKDVRKNHQKTIIDKGRLAIVEKNLKTLTNCSSHKSEMKNIMGVCDIYCRKGGKHTILFDGFVMKINSVFYCNIDDLATQIFSNKK